MDHFSFLATTAEISITLAGFVSLFLVLARRDGSFEPAVALSIRAILISSVGSLFFAALPPILAALGVSGTALWRFSSAVMLLTGISATLYVGRNRSRLPTMERKTIILRIATALNSLVIVAIVANVVGWPLSPNSGVYLASIWVLLGLSLTYFLGLVFGRILGEAASS